mmetsp:Transcript_51523/g.115929  ORF Transcript_51523/g.115929 Transcript_51523/m.115929 type:complete len:315 (-) Transcript_51523:62-1006(-)
MPEENAVTGCWAELKVAMAALEAASKASFANSATRLREAQRRAGEEAAEARKAAEEEARRHCARATETEAKIVRLEDKLQATRVEIAQLRELVDNYEDKLERKTEQLLALEDVVSKDAKLDTPSRLALKNESALEAPAPKTVKPLAEAPKLKRKARSLSSEPRRLEPLSVSEDSSPVKERKTVRRAPSPTGSPRRQVRVHDSRSPEARRRRLSADLSSPEPSTRRRSPSVSGTRSRSRSGSTAVRRSKGAGKGPSLCIPFIMGKCPWGYRCRERHPDPEDCKQAKESLMSKACRFGADCKRKDCIFKHPDNRKR